uniref:E3 ubiquitin-protein ligase E3D n=1 Tax=Glossina brevipalpis TaxID=37001 RepID=A0A1A9WSX8_9MUSC
MARFYIVIEVRSRISCANVFMQFAQRLNSAESLKLSLDKEKITFNHPTFNCDVLLRQHFIMVTNSLINLKVDENNAAFRMSIKCIHMEDKWPNDETYWKDIDLLPRIEENQELTLQCSNCGFVLCPKQSYNRVRAYPSGSMELSDFFCHHQANFGEILIPQIQDIFYGFECIILNKENLEGRMYVKESHLYCKRCLKFIGETMFKDKAVKLWSDAFTINTTTGSCRNIFPLSNLKNIQRLMFKIVRESSSTMPLYGNVHFVKVVLESKFPNRKNKYLLLHMLEKHLTILRGGTCELRNDNLTQQKSSQIDLIPYRAFKLLYKLINCDQDCKQPEDKSHIQPLLMYWQKDINILNLKISPYLFSELLDELDRNTLLLPKMYRESTDEFLSSYLFYN